MPAQVRAHVALFFVSFIYGANFTIAKVILDDNYVGPYALVLLRVSAGLLLFFLTHRFFIKEKVERKDWPLLALCGLTGVAVNQMLFIGGLKLTTHINAALISTTIPVAVIVASYFILKEKITARKILGIVLGLAGAATLTIYGKNFAYVKEGLLGDIMVFLNACSFGTFLVLVKTLMHKYNPITVTKWVFLFGFFFVFPFGIHELIEIPMNEFTLHIWMALAYVLICTTFLAYLLNTYALKLVDASTVSIYIYLQPLIATAIALFFGKDELTMVKCAAGILIFTGVFLVGKK